jgi:hypothetical protein
LARSPCFQNIQISENKASTRLKAQMGPSCWNQWDSGNHCK